MLFILLAIAPVAAQPVAASSAWIDETVVLSDYGWRYYFGTWMSGETAEVSIQVTSGGGITFYIMDEDNYNIWNSGGTPSAYVSKTGVMDTSFEWSVPTTQRYYFLLDNSDSSSSATVHIMILRYEQVQNGDGVQNGGGIINIGILAAIGIIVVIAVAAGVYYITTKAKTPVTTSARPAFKPRPSEPSSVQVQAVFCANCGARIPPGAGFCPNCGSPTTGRY